MYNQPKKGEVFGDLTRNMKYGYLMGYIGDYCNQQWDLMEMNRREC